MKILGKGISNKILLVFSSVLISIVSVILIVMSFATTAMTDSMMLSVTHSIADTMASNVSGNISNIAERFYLARSNRVITSATATDEEMNEFISSMRASMDFVWVGLYDLDGNVIAGSPDSPEKISELNIFPRLMKSNNLSIGNTAMGSSGLEIAMGLPIHREWLQSIYLVGSQRYDILDSLLHNFNVGQNSFVFIIDNNGELMAYSGQTEMFTLEGGSAAIIDSWPEAESIIEMMQSRQSGSQIVSSANNIVYISYTPVQETFWTLGIVTFRNDFTYNFNLALIGSIIGGIVIFLISVIVFRHFLSRMLTVPLLKITDSAALMALGQFDTDAIRDIANRDDEIGQLGVGFNTVSDSIHHVINDISLLTQMVYSGTLRERVNTDSYEGKFNTIISGINTTLDAFCAHLDAMPDAFALLNENCEIIFSNDSLNSLLASDNSPTEISEWLARLCSFGHSEELPRMVRRIFTGDNKQNYYADVVITDKKEEKDYYYSMTIKRIEFEHTVADDADNFICVMLLLTDTTQATNANIEAEIAKEGNKAKSNFLATMSHEIRTPMNAILGIAEIHLRDESLSPQHKDALNKICNSSNLLLRIINDLLDMSKIDAGKMELALVNYDMAVLISDIVNINLVRFSESRLTFELSVDENLPATLFGDDLRIKQILTNLISNAFKYTKTGSVRFSASVDPATATNSDNKTLVFVISDTGIGMSKEQVKTLFDEYSRFDMAANRTTEGTGLGMSIAYNLLHLMHGKINIESELNTGTEITVHIPQKNVSSDILGAEKARKIEAFNIGDISGDNVKLIEYEPMPYGKILIVDDVELNLYVAKGLLAPYGMDIETVESGIESLGIIKSGSKFDIIFMDHMMPEMDGMETVRHLRNMGYTHTIIALTADAVAGRDKMFLENGFDDFLSKPIDMRRMDMLLKKYIRDVKPPEVVKLAREYHAVEAAQPAGSPEQPANIDIFWDTVIKNTHVNTKIAMGHFSGMKEMYFNTFKLFHKNLPDKCAEMNRFLANQDIKGFAITVHAMKSLLATIGVTELSEAAKALEFAAKGDDFDFCVANYPSLEENLKSLHDDMSVAFVEEDAPDEEKQQGDRGYLNEQIASALDALDQFDSKAAGKILTELKAFDFGDEVNSLLNKALEAVDDYDFDKAMELLVVTQK